MFSSILNTDLMDSVKNFAKQNKITVNRNMNKDLFKDIENYVNKNNIIVSDIDILIQSKNFELKIKDTLYKEIYNIYCFNPFKHANELINSIASRIEKEKEKGNKEKWLTLKTLIPHKHLSILYKGMIIVNIFHLHEKNINLLISPILFKGFYTNKDLCFLPYEIELIDLYRKLYSPTKEFVEKWKDLLYIEPYLISKTNERIQNKVFTEIKGGDIVNIDSNTIKQMIIFKLLPENNFILIGQWAVNIIEFGLYGGTLKKSIEKVQIISEMEIKETFSIIKNHIKTILPNNPFEITYREHELHIPKDIRIRRYTIYIQIPCDEEGKCPVRQITLMDIFTNATYELIPWISSNIFLKKKIDFYPNIKIGNPYVLLRFFMLDMWILRIIFSKGLLIKNTVQKKLDNIWISVNKIRNPSKLGGIINKSFSIENYIGKYSDENIYFKNIIKEQKISDYFPYQWKKKEKSYRTI